MTRDENRELLESTHAFPGTFTWKVIGRSADGFIERILAEFREALDLEFDPPHTLRETSGGTHVSITIEPWVDTADTVLDLYDRLRNTDGLVVLL